MKLPSTKRLRKLMSVTFEKHNVTVVSSKTRDDNRYGIGLPYDVKPAFETYGSTMRKVDYKISWKEKENVTKAVEEIQSLLALSGSPQKGKVPYIYSWNNSIIISFYAYME